MRPDERMKIVSETRHIPLQVIMGLPIIDPKTAGSELTYILEQNTGKIKAVLAIPNLYYGNADLAAVVDMHKMLMDTAEDLPVIAYNIPQHTGVVWTPKALVELAEYHDGRVYVKDSVGSTFIAEQLHDESRVGVIAGSDFVVVGMNGDEPCPDYAGVISSSSNILFPEVAASWHDRNIESTTGENLIHALEILLTGGWDKYIFEDGQVRKYPEVPLLKAYLRASINGYPVETVVWRPDDGFKGCANKRWQYFQQYRELD